MVGMNVGLDTRVIDQIAWPTRSRHTSPGLQHGRIGHDKNSFRTG